MISMNVRNKLDFALNIIKPNRYMFANRFARALRIAISAMETLIAIQDVIAEIEDDPDQFEDFPMYGLQRIKGAIDDNIGLLRNV